MPVGKVIYCGNLTPKPRCRPRASLGLDSAEDKGWGRLPQHSQGPEAATLVGRIPCVRCKAMA